MYTLVGVDGNAFCVMGYVSNALRETGHRDLCDEYRKKATSGDYNNLLCVSMEYLDIVNDGLEEDEEDEYEDEYEGEFYG